MYRITSKLQYKNTQSLSSFIKENRLKSYLKIISITFLLSPISAMASDCSELPEKIRSCEKFTCKVQTDIYNYIVTHNVIGETPNGKCSYTSTVPVPPGAPNDLLMNCLFTKEVRQAYGNVLSKTLGIEINRDITSDNVLVNKALARDVCEIEGLEG